MLHFYAALQLASFGMCFMAIILAVTVYRRTRDKLVLYQGCSLVGALLFLLSQTINIYMLVAGFFQHIQPFQSFFVIGLFLSAAILFYAIPRFAFLFTERPLPKPLDLFLPGVSFLIITYILFWIFSEKQFREGAVAELVMLLIDFLTLVNLCFFTFFLFKNRQRIINPEARRLARDLIRVFAVFLPLYGFEVYICATDLFHLPYHFIFTSFMLFFWNLVNLGSLLRRFTRDIQKPTTIDVSTFKNFGLTKREEEVANLLILKLSYQEISDQLGISLPTVKTHVQKIYQKMNISRRSDMEKRLKEVS